jgi:hypothetical protein
LFLAQPERKVNRQKRRAGGHGVHGISFRFGNFFGPSSLDRAEVAMPGERGPDANYREIIRWMIMLCLCAAAIYGVTIWFIFWLMQ